MPSDLSRRLRPGMTIPLNLIGGFASTGPPILHFLVLRNYLINPDRPIGHTPCAVHRLNNTTLYFFSLKDLLSRNYLELLSITGLSYEKVQNLIRTVSKCTVPAERTVSYRSENKIIYTKHSISMTK